MTYLELLYINMQLCTERKSIARRHRTRNFTIAHRQPFISFFFQLVGLYV